MAVDKEDIRKIVAAVVGTTVAAGIAILASRRADGGRPYVPDYEPRRNPRNTNFDDEDEDESEEFDDSDEYEADFDDSPWDESNQFDGVSTKEEMDSAQQEFEDKNERNALTYLYIDFTQFLRTNSRNWDDVYKNSLEEQFESIKRKLALHGKNDIQDFDNFIRCCFPMIKSSFYVSMPGFYRNIEDSLSYKGAQCIYNMVLRPAKEGLVASIIPRGLDLILIGDLVFRNELITFVVKGIDLIDENVEKFGELKIECAATCAIQKNDRNLPDFGVNGRDLYKPFLTRDMVLSLCEKVYPIEHPERAISVFKKWSKYNNFRKYYLDVVSQRHELLDDVKCIKAYIIEKNEYRKHKNDYEDKLLNGIKAFAQKDPVYLSEKSEDSIEVPVIMVEIVRNLAELTRNQSKNKRNSNYEIALRRFSRNQVALSRITPESERFSLKQAVFLGDRIAFEYKDVEPDCSDIEQCFERRLETARRQVDKKYDEIIKNSIEEYKKSEESRLSKSLEKEIDDYSAGLDKNLENDVANNTDSDIRKKNSFSINSIKEKFNKKRKALEESFKKKKENEKNEEKLKEELKLLSDSEAKEISSISLRDMYLKRNELLKKNFKTTRTVQYTKELQNLCSTKENSLKNELLELRNKEKKEFECQNNKECQEQIEKKKTALTERHFCIYYKADEIDPSFLNNEKKQEYRFLVYDNRAESAKIERQRKTLDSFAKGYVKNPFLASYIFVPESLGKSENLENEVEWFSNRLNDSQKEAVRKALASNSLFLLQGPPGTGKTEVIAEITAQCIKQGKKVLVSSETHKAIDNVFERLPKIPEIRPIRLIPSLSNKDTNYSPEKLVDNLYQGISSCLKKRITQYENFTEMKDNFGEKMKDLKFMLERLQKLEKECKKLQEDKSEWQKRISSMDSAIEQKRELRKPLLEQRSQYENIEFCLDRGNFWDSDEKSELLINAGKVLFDLMAKYDFFYDLDNEKVAKIFKLNLDKVKEDFDVIEEHSSSMTVEQEKASIRAKIKSLRDPDTEEPYEDKIDEYRALQKQLISLKNKNSDNGDLNFSTLSVSSYIDVSKLSDKLSRDKILNSLVELKDEINKIIEKEKSRVSEFENEISGKINSIDDEISGIKLEREELLKKIENVNEDNSYSEYKNKQQELRKAIVDFFSDFEILDEYPANDFSTAIGIIEKKWGEIERDQEKLQKENTAKIPMYQSICNYLSDEEILEDDRVSYTKKLFDNANVFGMTCTSREYYSESSMKSLKEYKLGNVNIKDVGIDVVIIDEVSKSSFLDLMIPILYGKTVILVGDHRQLPPLYDLKHLRREDFDGLDSEIIDFDINKDYQKLCETCFFKELFEQVPSQYKIMLDKQYRCHSDIMDVFNHFYSTNGKGLSIGKANQNDEKNHDLTIKHNNVTLIEPNKHIYFVNCPEYESHIDSESSSIINRQEAEVAHQLLLLIDNEYGKMIESGKIRKDNKKDERKSVGVICSYRDQAKLIKNSLKGKKLTSFAQGEEKLVINTVDDFQGDERDVIILSMVRNPRGDRYNTDFIDQFERINVALSRARCLLIVLGSMQFLSRSSIDLPDINGNKDLDRHGYPVYREIIKTIGAKGKILQASDVIDEVKYAGK